MAKAKPGSLSAGEVLSAAFDTTLNSIAVSAADGSAIGGGTQYAVDAALGATPTGTVLIGKRDDVLSTLTPIEGDAVEARFDANGGLWVSLATRLNLTDDQVGIGATTTGGATPFKRVSTADTNAASVKASAGTLYGATASSVNAAARYLKLYNKASAPTVGTDVPVKTLIIPGNTAGAGTNLPIPAVGVAFGTGIAMALTTEATDAGTTGVSANEHVVNLDYK